MSPWLATFLLPLLRQAAIKVAPAAVSYIESLVIEAFRNSTKTTGCKCDCGKDKKPE